ncbi:MAG: ABC transporter substrate-binding protein [Euryarchaeota archaeon]|nr:ABC transporter substrate-binding protein [Euryarchaeota archaeon]
MRISMILPGIVAVLLLFALPAAASDFTLGVFGNANEDDTINMQDVTYTELIILEYRDQTELSDAKYDGKINMQDVTQIELVILGKEKELTLLQYMGYPPDLTEKPVTVPMPVERMVVLSNFAAETVCAFEAADKIVGVIEGSKMRGETRTLLGDTPSVGTGHDITHGGFDMEKVLELNPDIVLTYSYTYSPETDEQLNAAGIPLVHADFSQPEKHPYEIRNLGWLLGNRERAEELISFEKDHTDIIKERVKDLEPEERTKAYYCLGVSYYGDPTHVAGGGTAHHNNIELCGGTNIFADVDGYVGVDAEEIIVRNPEVIIAMAWSSATGEALGYDITDTGPVDEVRTEYIMNYFGFDHIDAVRDDRVYFISSDASSTHQSVWLSYLAKYLHPTLFEDVDPAAIHKEWFETFLGVEYQGVYAYPTPWTEEN